MSGTRITQPGSHGEEENSRVGGSTLTRETGLGFLCCHKLEGLQRVMQLFLDDWFSTCVQGGISEISSQGPAHPVLVLSGSGQHSSHQKAPLKHHTEHQDSGERSPGTSPSLSLTLLGLTLLIYEVFLPRETQGQMRTSM